MLCLHSLLSLLLFLFADLFNLSKIYFPAPTPVSHLLLYVCVYARARTTKNFSHIFILWEETLKDGDYK